MNRGQQQDARPLAALVASLVAVALLARAPSLGALVRSASLLPPALLGVAVIGCCAIVARVIATRRSRSIRRSMRLFVRLLSSLVSGVSWEGGLTPARER
jgi:hypothetical protein